MVTRQYTGILVCNWKTGEMKIIKAKSLSSRRTSLGAYEIPVHIDLAIELPERPELKVKGKIKIPQYKVAEMTMEEL